MNVNDIIELTLVQLLQGSRIINTFHYEIIQVAPSGDDEDSLVSQFIGQVLTPLRAAQSSDVTHLQIETRRISPAPPTMPRVWATGGTGTGTGNSGPSEIAAVVQRKAVFAGRVNRGRIYVAGIPEASIVIASGAWNAATIALLIPIGQAIVLTLDGTMPPGGGVYIPGLWNRPSSLFTGTINWGVNTIPRGQRRRQPGVGT